MIPQLDIFKFKNMCVFTFLTKHFIHFSLLYVGNKHSITLKQN